jgi:hypothetical protein
MVAMPPPWNPRVFEPNLVPEPRYPSWDHFCRLKAWPGIDELNSAYDRFKPDGAPPLKFVVQAQPGQRKAKKLKRAGLAGNTYYAKQIVEDLVVPTRLANWHDLFNALTWMTFPCAKYRLQQIFLREGNDDERRSKMGDVLACFDEGGVVVVLPREQYEDGMCVLSSENMEEKQEYIERFGNVAVFGHAIYETVLINGNKRVASAPVVMALENPFFEKELTARYAEIDQRLAEHLQGSKNIFATNRSFSVGSLFKSGKVGEENVERP